MVHDYVKNDIKSFTILLELGVPDCLEIGNEWLCPTGGLVAVSN